MKGGCESAPKKDHDFQWGVLVGLFMAVCVYGAWLLLESACGGAG